MNIDKFLASLAEQNAKGKVSSDMLAVAKTVSGSVKSFLTTNNVGVAKEDFNTPFKISGSFDTPAFEAIGPDAIFALVDSANIRPEFREQAAASIATMLYRSADAGKDFTSIAASQTARAEANNGSLISCEDIMPASVRQQYVTVGMETFGADSDKVNSDLQVAMTVSLLKWHNTITPRVVPNIPTTQPVVNYVREEIKVYELDSEVDTDKSVLDMYADPSVITQELTRIIPLNANEVAGEVVADGVLAFNKEANLVALGVNAVKYGQSKYNRTDIVADGIKLDKVLISITATIDMAPVTETFEIAIPESRGRLTRSNNQVATLRSAHVEHTVVLTAASKTYAGADSDVLAFVLAAAPTDKVVVKLTATPRVDIRNGHTYTLGSVTVSAVSALNGTANATNISVLGAATTALVGYSLDARYAEENMRQSNIATITERTQLVYEIPQGRNFVLDIPLNGPQIDRSNNVANLHNIIRIGQDNVTIQTIMALLDAVGVATEAYAADPVTANNPGARYAAGGRVRPTFIQDTLDMANIDSFDDSKRQDAVEGRAMTFLNSVCQQIMTQSYYKQQLDGNTAPTFRLITHGNVLANVIGAKPGDYQLENTNGVELTLKLSSGVIVECITTTFDYMLNKMIIVPHLSGNPSSELNFGHNRDYGTVVGSYTHNDNGSAVQRLLANIREMVVPTNVIGAIIDVAHIEDAMYR